MVRLFGNPKPLFRVDCGSVKRINSVGVRSLKMALRRMTIDGSKFVLEGVTSPLVEAIDFVSNLLPDGTVIESVYLPYACPDCMQSFQVLFRTGDLAKDLSNAESAPCPQCGKDAEFDHMPEVYYKTLFGSEGSDPL